MESAANPAIAISENLDQLIRALGESMVRSWVATVESLQPISYAKGMRNKIAHHKPEEENVRGLYFVRFSPALMALLP